MEKGFYYASFVLGLALAVLCSMRVGKKRGLPQRDAAAFTMTGFLSGVIGAVLMAQVYNAVLRAVAGDEPFSPSNFSLYCAAGVYLLLGTAKLGCFSYGCCYGIDCDFGAVNWFTGTRTFPVQLLEAALTFCIAALLYAVSVGRLPKKRLSSGAVYPLGLVLYGVMRFFIQFLRAHEIAAEADLIGFLDLWQTVSVVAVLTGAVWLIFLARKRSV